MESLADFPPWLIQQMFYEGYAWTQRCAACGQRHDTEALYPHRVFSFTDFTKASDDDNEVQRVIKCTTLKVTCSRCGFEWNRESDLARMTRLYAEGSKEVEEKHREKEERSPFTWILKRNKDGTIGLHYWRLAALFLLGMILARGVNELISWAATQ